MTNFFLALIFIFSGCGPDSEISFFQLPSQSQNQQQEEENQIQMPDTFVISGTFPLEADRTGKIFCIAQGEYLSTCTAEIDNTTGDFACDGIYVDSPVTCFYRNSDNTETLATIEFAEDDEVTYPGYLSRSTLAISLTGSVDLGNLTYDSTNPLISTNYSNIEAKISSENTPLDLTEIANIQTRISCITTGDSIMDTNCENFLNCGSLCTNVTDLLYFRKIPTTKDAISKTAFGLWTNENQFKACTPTGNPDRDLNNTLKSKFNTDGITIDNSINIGSFDRPPNCLIDGWVEDNFLPGEPGNMKYFVNLGYPLLSGNSSTIYQNNFWSYSSENCRVYYTHNITIFNDSKIDKKYGFYYVKKFQEGTACTSPEVYAKDSHFIFEIN